MSERKKIEFPLIQLYSLVSTAIGFCLLLYFFILLNARLSVYDFQHPIYGWTEIHMAVPYGSLAILLGFVLIFFGIILGIYGSMAIKRNEIQTNQNR